MTQRYLDLADTTLFVDDRGSSAAPALLYVHGGPGFSCWDFMRAMGERLASGLRVVGVDQRGVLRSGPVGTGPLTVERLVADYELVRQALDVERWAILGHSAGGATALDYAVSHPGSVAAALFDCPCWDCDSTDRYRLPVVAGLLERYGRLEEAARCRELAATERRLTADDEAFVPMQALGDHYQDLFFADPAAGRELELAQEQSGFGEESWARGMSHLPLLADMYVDRLPLLERLSVPSMTIHGRDDLVVTPRMLEAYLVDVPDARLHVFERSGHFAYHEQPEEYAEVVTSFVLEHAS